MGRILLLLLLAAACPAADSIRLLAVDAPRRSVDLPADTTWEERVETGRLGEAYGWIEWDVPIPADGWYELWLENTVDGWLRDVYVDGEMLLRLTTSSRDDARPGHRAQFKEANLHLTAGNHTLRVRRLQFPGILPIAIELTPGEGRAEASIRGRVTSRRVLPLGQDVVLELLGGGPLPLLYDILLQGGPDDELIPVTTVDFPATTEPVRRDLRCRPPAEGIWRLLARADGVILPPAVLKTKPLVIVDTAHPTPAGNELARELVVDVDCIGQTINGVPAVPGETFFEKDGATRVVDAPFGKYRESSGDGSVANWATDGFSYRFDLPDEGDLYQLVVDYPDDDRRTMGFWVNDGYNKKHGGVTLCGGVETGDRYRTTRSLLQHEAFFYPLGRTNVVVAVLNLTHGCRAAASRIRIYRVTAPLPAGPAGSGRHMGYYFEESGRWIRHFGGDGSDGLTAQIKTLDRWGQWNRYIGADLMYPTINVYQANHYPSDVLQGYFNRQTDECRLTALIAQRYGCRYVPEFHLSGNYQFDKRTMGVKRGGKAIELVKPEARDYVLQHWDKNFRQDILYYNCLHPTIQDLYIRVFGELADRLADCPAFAGISSRLMLGWQWQGWNALPGLNWGYGDWTVHQFEQDTGVRVPVDPAGDVLRQRRDFLLGPARADWIKWRNDRVFAYHCRLRDRIRQARPDARLFFSWFGPSPREVETSDQLEQLRQIGMDWERYANEPGIVIVPSVSYGRRYSTPVADSRQIEDLAAPGTAAIGRLGDRGFGLYTSYFEVNANLDWSQLGGQEYCAFDCTAPAGVHERELYALALADSDASFLVNGGNGWLFGTPPTLSPFLAEYRRLPAAPFLPYPGARDPVAVWTHVGADRFWFYAVNRQPYAVEVAVSLTGAADEHFTLAPYMLKTFALAPAARVAGVQVTVPPAEIERLQPMREFARRVGAALERRTIAPELTDAQAKTALGLLAEAIAAGRDGHYWRAEKTLERTDLIRLWDIIGYGPPRLHDRQVSRYFDPAPDRPALTPLAILGDTRGHLANVTVMAATPEGELHVANEDQYQVFDADGKYRRSHQLFRPHEPDSGDIRWTRLDPPQSMRFVDLGTMPDGELAGLHTWSNLYTWENALGRLVRQYPNPGTNCHAFAVDPAGNIFLSCYLPEELAGIWAYDADGHPRFPFAARGCRLGDRASRPLAVDSAGRLYLVNGKTVTVSAADGSELQTFELRLAPGPVAVRRDGSLLVAGHKYGSLDAWRREGDALVPAWTTKSLGGGITALAFLPGDALAVGFDREVDGAVVHRYALTADGPGERTPLVRGIAALDPPILQGFTQLKVVDGRVCFTADRSLMALRPGATDRIEKVWDTGIPRTRPQSFAFAPNGDLYLAANDGFYAHARGILVYRAARTADGWEKPVMINDEKPLVDSWAYTPSDLAFDRQGRLIVRLPEDEHQTGGPTVSIWARAEDGAATKLAYLGGTIGWGSYGLHVGADGGVYVAGGGTRCVVRLAPDGSELWRRQFRRDQGPGSLPIRNPIGITTDSAGRVWTTDSAGCRILCFAPDGRFLGAYGHFGDVDDTDGMSLSNPVGIAAVPGPDGADWLYVADVGNQRLIKYAIQTR